MSLKLRTSKDMFAGPSTVAALIVLRCTAAWGSAKVPLTRRPLWQDLTLLDEDFDAYMLIVRKRLSVLDGVADPQAA